MIRIGCHLSSSKGFLAMGKQITELGGNTFQYFTRNPRGSRGLKSWIPTIYSRVFWRTVRLTILQPWWPTPPIL